MLFWMLDELISPLATAIIASEEPQPAATKIGDITLSRVLAVLIISY